MHGTPYEQAVALSREGRFRDALQALSGAEMRVENVTLQTLRAELLEQTGAYAEAEQLAASIRRSRQLDRSLASRCEVVIGHIALSGGRIEEAHAHYRLAVDLATAAGDLEQLCWAQLHLLYSMRMCLGETPAVSLLSQLRRNATRLGNSNLSAALHLAVAHMEGDRGSFDVSERHIKIAQSILATHPNSWLNARAEVAWTSLDYFRDDLRAARLHADRALSVAIESGAAMEWASALGNVGHLLLAEGAIDEARSCIEQALLLAKSDGMFEVALVEGLARSYLLEGNFVEVLRLLQRVKTLTASTQERVPYSYRWSQVTLVRLAIDQGDYQQAAHLASLSVGVARKASDRRLESTVLVAWAEALVGLKKHLEARRLLAEVLPMRDESIEVFASVERVLGIAFAAADQRDLATSHFGRSIRAFASIGNRVSESRAKSELQSSSAAASFVSPGAQLAGGSSANKNGETIPAAMTIESIIASAAALMHLVESPDAIGAEAITLLGVTGCASRAVLECVDTDSHRQVVSCVGAIENATNSSGPDHDCGLRIDIGESRCGRLSVSAMAGESLAAVNTLQGIGSLVAAAVELRDARAKRRRAAALWPFEEEETLSDDLPGIFAGDKSRALMDLVRRTANMQINILITGETGTGKELIARLIHKWSQRAKLPFVPFNCSAVPRDMLDAQLFGHKRGAFTGAVDSFQGIIRGASGGVLFLDEIGELAIELQPKLLRFLESAEVHPIGEARPSRVDVRVVAATNADLDQLAREKRFREDLLYRLNVLQIRMPPLRERRDEIPLLARHFLEKHSTELGRSDVGISAEALEFLALRDWPGNIRELSNTIRRAVALAREGAVLMPEHVCPQTDSVPSSGSTRFQPQPQISIGLEQPLVSAFQQIERAMILHAIRRTGGQMEEAARLLGLSRKGLYLKRQRLCVEI